MKIDIIVIINKIYYLIIYDYKINFENFKNKIKKKLSCFNSKKKKNKTKNTWGFVTKKTKWDWILIWGARRFMSPLFFLSNLSLRSKEAFSRIGPVLGHLSCHCLEASAPLLCWVRALASERTLMPEKIEGRRRGGSKEWDGETASPTQWTWIWANSKR